jgi:hypothetical protein
LASASVNSFDWDPVTQDWIIGTRYGFMEVWVHAQQARKKIGGVGSNATATANSIAGIAHAPRTAGLDTSYGAGCQGYLSWEPTDSSFGAPSAGNNSFRLGLFSAEGGTAVILLIGLNNTQFGTVPLPFDLAPLGLTPNCFLRTDILLAIAAVTSGTGAGEGQAVIPLPIPVSAMGGSFYRQWVALQLTPTNPAGLVVSNARKVTVQ